jgi:hypothetical protein
MQARYEFDLLTYLEYLLDVPPCKLDAVIKSGTLQVTNMGRGPAASKLNETVVTSGMPGDTFGQHGPAQPTKKSKRRSAKRIRLINMWGFEYTGTASQVMCEYNTHPNTVARWVLVEIMFKPPQLSRSLRSTH